MRLVHWAALPLVFVLGCLAHSLTQDAEAAPHAETCITKEESEELRARISAIEDRLEVHSDAIRRLVAQALEGQSEHSHP